LETGSFTFTFLHQYAHIYAALFGAVSNIFFTEKSFFSSICFTYQKKEVSLHVKRCLNNLYNKA